MGMTAPSVLVFTTKCHLVPLVVVWNTISNKNEWARIKTILGIGPYVGLPYP